MGSMGWGERDSVSVEDSVGSGAPSQEEHTSLHISLAGEPHLQYNGPIS